MSRFPAEQRVRRADLFATSPARSFGSDSDSDSPSSDHPSRTLLTETHRDAPTTDDVAQQLLLQRLNSRLGVPDPAPVSVSVSVSASRADTTPRDAPTTAANAANKQEDEYEFRLFSTTKPALSSDHTRNISSGGGAAATSRARALPTKIRLPPAASTPPARADGAADLRTGQSKGGFVRPDRGWEYYFLLPPSSVSSPDPLPGHNIASSKAWQEHEALRRTWARVRASAVSGADVRAMGARFEWVGCRVPWRVTHLRVTGHSRKVRAAATNADGAARVVVVAASVTQEEGEGEQRKRRGRVGKKTRIARRERARAEMEEERGRGEKERRKMEGEKRKEDAVREKKNAANRKNKARRREKARAAKAAVATSS